MVAPVNAEMGFMVMFPQSLYQISRWMLPVISASKPAFRRSSARSRRRFVPMPEGSPRMSRLPGPARTKPGSGEDAPRWTTQPITRSAGIARAMRDSGSTDRRTVPSNFPPKPWKNHQGTPFIAGRTIVSSPRRGRRRSATAARAGALTAITTRSWTPSSAGFSTARTAAAAIPSPVRSRSPFVLSAASVSPRATADSSQPASARP